VTAADLLPIEDDATILEVSGLAKVRPEAVRRVLRGDEVWPRTYRAVRDEYAAKGVDVPPMAERAARRPPPRPCPACAAKDEELAALRAKVHTAGNALMAKDAELAETERQLEHARQHLLSEMRDWKRQYLEACTERDTARARVLELEAERQASDAALAVALESPAARAPAAAQDQPAEPEPQRLVAGPPFTRPPVCPAPRPREKCCVRVLMPGEELLPDGTVTTPAAAAG